MEYEENICAMPFRQVLSERMKRTWKKVADLEKRGEVITYERFGEILREVCREIKEERKKCRL